MMKVLLLTPELPRDEHARVPHHITQEIRFLSQLPLELHVLTGVPTAIQIPNVRFHVMPQTGGDPLKVAQSAWFSIRTGLGLRNYAAAKKNRFVIEMIHRHEIDVLHSHWAYPDGTGAVWAARAAGVPSIMTLRGVEINVDRGSNYGYRLDAAYETVLRRSLREASRITVASSASMQSVQSLIGPNDKTIWLPNGIDLDRFEPAHFRNRGEERPSVADGPLHIFSMGGLVRNKRHDVVLTAVSRLRARRRNAHCVLGGDGPLRTDLERQIQVQSLQGIVELAGAIHFDQVPRFYEACDVFAFASSSEGFGNVLVEAMAMSKPVVTTPVGIAKDVIQDGVNGLLVPFDDPDAMANKLEFLMDNPDKARKIGERARATVVPRFSIRTRVASFMDLYRDLHGGS